MTRISLMVAVAVAAGVVGCAHCDTCDDFPTPCTGPNCGQPFGASGLAPVMDQGAPMMGQGAPVMVPMAGPAGDSAGPAPATPPSASVPPADAASPPVPTEPTRP